MYSRGEIPNDMHKNGELVIQKNVILAFERAHLKRKIVIFDVGANVGDWTISLLNEIKNKILKNKIDIYLFEPVPSTAEMLSKNLPDEKFLHLNECALSSTSTTANIYISGENAGTNSLYDDKLKKEKQLVEIHLISAVDFCNKNSIQHIDLLKCDTEGHDMEVILGALPLLKDEKISIFQFEYNWRWAFSNHFLRDVFISVESLPYKLAKLQENHLLIFDTWHPEIDKFFEGNYALIHNDSLSWFPKKRACFDRFNALQITPYP